MYCLFNCYFVLRMIIDDNVWEISIFYICDISIVLISLIFSECIFKEI